MIYLPCDYVSTLFTFSLVISWLKKIKLWPKFQIKFLFKFKIYKGVLNNKKIEVQSEYMAGLS